MKKTLLFAIMVLAMNVYAQHRPGTNLPPNPLGKSIKTQNPLLSQITPLLFDQSITGTNHSARSVFGLVQLIDSVYAWGWDTLGAKLTLESRTRDITYNADNFPLSATIQTRTGNTWENSLQIVSTYDANNNETSSLLRQWNGTSWDDFFKTVRTFDGNNNATTELTQLWTGFSWFNLSNTIYTYDNNHHILTEIYQSWSGTAWTNSSKTTNTWSGDDLTSTLTQYWDDVNAVWINQSQVLYTHDANHNLLTTTSQNWNGLSWDNTSLSTYTYDGNHNQLTDLEQYWDGTGWVNISKTTNTYNGNLLTTSLTQNWNGASYDNAGRTTNTYNGSLLTKSLMEIWDGGSWQYSHVSFYSYGENDFIAGEGNREYDGATNTITSGDSTHYYFKTVAGTKDIANGDVSLAVYPNPSTGKFIFTSDIGLGNIAIYNSIGARVYFTNETKGQNKAEVNMAGYSSGMYMAIIQDGEKTTTRKIMIQ